MTAFQVSVTGLATLLLPLVGEINIGAASGVGAGGGGADPVVKDQTADQVNGAGGGVLVAVPAGGGAVASAATRHTYSVLAVSAGSWIFVVVAIGAIVVAVLNAVLVDTCT